MPLSVAEKETDIEELINVINNCTSLLIPTPDDFFLENDESETTVCESHHEEDFDMRLFGLRSSYNLEIKINPENKLRVERSDENAAVIENLRESVKIAKKRYITLVAKWADMVKKYSEDSSYIKKVEDLKTRLDACVKKYKDLDIRGCDDDDDDSDDDADMVEVIKEGYEAEVLPIFQEKLKANVEPKPGPSSAPQDILESSNHKPQHAEEIPEPVPDWQDPELLAQLKASTGIDLKMPEKRKKGIRKKKPALGEEVKEMVKTRNFPGISNIGILKNNPKARLKKKIFNRFVFNFLGKTWFTIFLSSSAVRRVAEACNKLDRRK